MNKTWIIIQREFLSRVRKKTFLLTTILLPVLILGFYALIIYFSVKGESEKKVAVLDNYNLFEGKIEDGGSAHFSFIKDISADSLKSSFVRKGYDAFLYIPAGLDLARPANIVVYGKDQVGVALLERIKSRVNRAIERKETEALLGGKVSIDELNKIKSNADVRSVSLKDGQETEGNAAVATGVAFAMGLLVYFVLMIYGSMVMRGVMEEKTSRIAEVMVSSVKPFQLMMGKIIGIGAVGLVQFLIWGILIIGLQFMLPIFFPDAFAQIAAHAGPAGNMPEGMSSSALPKLIGNLQSLHLPSLIIGFIVYFLGGYFLYSSLFAAVGSAVNEDPQDAQQLMIPIMMPIIFAFVILTKVIQDPNSSLAIFGSLFPLTSPIVMMGRLPFGVPFWQLGLSIIFLVAGFLLTTWLAAKIYRTGILMYGKKVTWKEMWKWVVRKS